MKTCPGAPGIVGDEYTRRRRARIRPRTSGAGGRVERRVDEVLGDAAGAAEVPGAPGVEVEQLHALPAGGGGDEPVGGEVVDQRVRGLAGVDDRRLARR